MGTRKSVQSSVKNLRLLLGASLVLAFAGGVAFQAFISPISSTLAEQVDGSPESGTSSRLTQAYESVAGQGHGVGSVPQWTEDWGSTWNRIMSAASWMPGGSVGASQVMMGETYYAGNRSLKTGTLDVGNFSQIGLYQGLEHSTHWTETQGFGTWTELQATGGSPASVTANGSTLTLASTRVMQDDRTKLIWSDSSATTTYNNFTWVAGDSRVNPTGNSCNFNTTGTANTWCNVSDFSAPDYVVPANNVTPDQAKTGVAASEFCLNLSANDGGGVKTDWRVPTQRELTVAYLNGSGSNLSNANRNYWSSSEVLTNKTASWYVSLTPGHSQTTSKVTNSIYVRCVRG